MKQILALAGKDLRLLLRDKAGAFFVFFFPLLFAIFFGLIFSGAGDEQSSIPIALVDEDSSAGSAKFIEKLNKAAELEVLPTTRSQAISLVRSGKRAAYVVLTKGFGPASDRMFWGDAAKIELGLDPSRKAEAGMLEGVLTRYFMEGFQANFTDRGKMRGHLQESIAAMNTAPDSERAYWSPLANSLKMMDDFFAQPTVSGDSGQSGEESSGWQPLKVEVSDVSVKRVGPKNPFDVTFPQSVIWGLIGCAAAFGISLVVERSKGTLVRLRMAPLSRRQVLTGKAVACFVSNLGVSLLMIALAIAAFNVRPYSLPWLALAIVCCSLCFTGIMMLLSVMGRTEASASGIGWAVLLVMSMIGGGMIPIFFMPPWMRLVGSFSPVKWAIITLEGAVWRGFSPVTMLAHCALLLGIGTVFFAIGATIFTRRGD
jgi:ABC-2 type transport system permease protein